MEYTFIFIDTCIPYTPIIGFTGEYATSFMPGGENERNYWCQESLYDRRFLFAFVNGCCAIIKFIVIKLILGINILWSIEILKFVVAGLITRSYKCFLCWIIRCHVIDAILVMFQTSPGHIRHGNDTRFDFSSKWGVRCRVSVIGLGVFSGKKRLLEED